VSGGVADRYNYRRFEPGDYEFERFEGPAEGEAFPEFDAYTPDGEPLDRQNWLGRPTVVETGSVTCPAYRANVEPMRRVRDRYSGVRFVVLYTREAHPGKHLGPHASLEDKLRRARQLRDGLGEDRELVVDDPSGSLHRAIGGFPNSVHVLDAEGRVVYRAEWASAGAVDEVLGRLTAGRPVEWVRPKPLDPRSAPLRALRTAWAAGPDALWDLVKALPALVGKRRELEARWDEREAHEAQV